jgi:aldehyde:ferredoxin oxidoreductase
MKETDNVAHRLALLAGVDLSKADLQSIANEIEDLERVVAELEEFAQATPWISQQVQPPGKKA